MFPAELAVRKLRQTRAAEWPAGWSIMFSLSSDDVRGWDVVNVSPARLAGLSMSTRRASVWAVLVFPLLHGEAKQWEWVLLVGASPRGETGRVQPPPSESWLCSAIPDSTTSYIAPGGSLVATWYRHSTTVWQRRWSSLLTQRSKAVGSGGLITTTCGALAMGSVLATPKQGVNHPR